MAFSQTKLPRKVVTYRDFKKFKNERFMDSLKLTLDSQYVDYTKNLQLFFELCWNEIEHHAPRQKKYNRGNKMLSKFIAEITYLRNTSLKISTVQMCITSQKSKKGIFCQPNEKNITGSRKFWQTVKSFLSEKNKSREKITLVKNVEIISDDVEVANTLNIYFLNAVKSLKIPKKILTDSLPQSLLSRHPTLNSILKYKNHPSMHVIKRVSQRFSNFIFHMLTKILFLKRLKRKLNLNKAVEDSDIPVQILKENADFFY